MKNFGGYFILVANNEGNSSSESIDPSITDIDIAVDIAKKSARDNNSCVVLWYIEKFKRENYALITPDGRIMYL